MTDQLPRTIRPGQSTKVYPTLWSGYSKGAKTPIFEHIQSNSSGRNGLRGIEVRIKPRFARLYISTVDDTAILNPVDPHSLSNWQVIAIR